MKKSAEHKIGYLSAWVLVRRLPLACWVLCPQDRAMKKFALANETIIKDAPPEQLRPGRKVIMARARPKMKDPLDIPHEPVALCLWHGAALGYPSI